ncbi:MAG: uracil-DNA glycosylase [Pseudomonadota bacterium]
MSRSIEAILEFYVAAGVDLPVDDVPRDRFADLRNERDAKAERDRAQAAAVLERVQASGRSEPSRSAPAIARPPADPISADEAVMSARQAAASAQTLDELRDILSRFEGCGLRKTAKSLVFSDGDPKARLMLVGEAPGRDEDIAGKPFVGRSGQLLDRMLKAIGYARSDIYVANTVPWRPPGNRTPSPQEAEICRPFIERQIALADPDVLVLLGNAPAQQLLRKREGITRLRGVWRSYETDRRTIPVMATWHPAYLLRQTAQKRNAWRDFLEIKAKLSASAA